MYSVLDFYVLESKIVAYHDQRIEKLLLLPTKYRTRVIREGYT
jgi:hypothetical protein